jgi:hypothetical protein
MRLVQEKINHRNEAGKIISLSAWRQWHVERGGQLIPVLELKDPALARKRGRGWVSLPNDPREALAELGLLGAATEDEGTA